MKMSLDLDRITHPLRLATGSHQPGSGKGCAMNVISYINGDTEITDYPDCSARPLAALVQLCNDQLAGTDDYLSPENSLIVLDLGWQTVGTAGAPEAVHARWIAEILTNPDWGVVRYADKTGADAIRSIAELHRAAARGKITYAWRSARSAAWDSARDSAQSAAQSATRSAAQSATRSATRSAAQSAPWGTLESAAQSAAQSAAWGALETAAWSALETAAGSAGYAARGAAYIDFTRRAILCWRELAQLDTPSDISSVAVESALARF